MIMHGIPNAKIAFEDTLVNPAFENSCGVERFDRVIANPPFSQNYKRNDKMRHQERFLYGWAPETGKKANLMFVQHMIASLKDNGMMITVMPHGVLFRGGKEGDIRKAILNDPNDIVQAIISLPPDLFYGTGIPACLIVINKNKRETNPELAGKILIINADAEYGEGKNQNYLRPEDIEKIIYVFEHSKEEPKYSRIVPISEILDKEKNDGNLNIRRYVDNSPDQEPQNVRAHISGGVPKDEVEKLRNIAKDNLSGVITTNYDCFFENIFEGYKTFVGQDELVFSQLQGIAEIYKIHGSVQNPESIVINKADYQKFHDKGKYLAAKLMTIFMEYPIIFIGYSISDSDIQAILSDVVECLPLDKIETLQKRFVFVEYKPDFVGSEITSHSMIIRSKLLEMTKITLSDFSLLYDALSVKKAALPVKLLRRFKDELYTFALTQQPGPTMQVASLEDGRIDENMLALSIGLATTGVYGLARAVNSEQWYRNIILHDSLYSCEQLLEFVYPELAKQNSWKLPVWYYISKSNMKSELAEEKAPHLYTEIVTESTIKRNHSAIGERTAWEVWTQEKDNLMKAIRLLGCMSEEKIDVTQYRSILEAIFTENNNILSSLDSPNRSNLHRMIRIYDFLEYGQKKTP